MLEWCGQGHGALRGCKTTEQVVSTNHRQQQVERIGCSARARDGWRRGWHGGARLSARLPMEQAMEARTCTGRCGLGAPSEKLFSLSSVFGAATSKTRPGVCGHRP